MTQAINIGLGSDSLGNPTSYVDLIPGSFHSSIVFASNFCTSVGSPCHTRQAGLYDANKSVSVHQNASIVNEGFENWGSWLFFNQSGHATDVLDQTTFQGLQGEEKITNTQLTVVYEESVTIFAFKSQAYSPPIGLLGLGSPGGIDGQISGAISTTIPADLAKRGVTPSDSFGLHCGSAALGVEGSLVWGGYDQSRILGDVGVFPLSHDYIKHGVGLTNLSDVYLGGDEGSPVANVKNLLYRSQSNVPDGATYISPAIPYMFLGFESCQNIAQHLPVTLQPSLGLYTWDTEDWRYQRIMHSKSFLALVFKGVPSLSSGNLTIKIPFPLLNLTLEPPIVTSQQQYFPCQPSSADIDEKFFFLGRAFLQAAFFGINWQSQSFFLAQAPGPNHSPADIRPMFQNQRSMTSNPLSTFSDSWVPTWGNDRERNVSTNTSAQGGDSHHRISPGVVAGILVSAAVVAIAVIAVAVIMQRRRKRSHLKQQTDLRQTETELPAKGLGEVHEAAAPRNKHEMMGNAERLTHEMHASSLNEAP